MSRADYAHWNEDADFMWWHEEGKHVEEPPEPDDDELFAHRDIEDDEERCRRCDEVYDLKTNAKGDHWPFCDECFAHRQQEKLAIG